MLSILSELEKHGLSHGDIHPGNVVLAKTESRESIKPVLIDFLNMNDGGQVPYCKNYVPANHENLSADSLDRYATVKMISEVAEKVGPIKLYQYAIHLVKQNEITSGEILRFIDAFDELVGAVVAEPPSKYVVHAKIKSEDEFRSDEGKFYVSVKDARTDKSRDFFRIYISGMSKQLDLHVSSENNTIERLFFKPVSHSQFIRNKNTCDLVVEGEILLRKALHNESQQLITKILDSAINVSNSDDDEDEGGYLQAQSENEELQISASLIWSALAQTEEETFPSVTALHDSEVRRDGSIIIQYESESNVIDFNLERDTVNVQKEIRGEYRSVGILSLYNAKFLQISPTRGTFDVSAGETIRLESQLSASSLFKRRAAVEALTKNRSIIAGLPRYFSTNESLKVQNYADTPSEKDLDLYTTRDQSGNVLFELNENQRQAFKTLYSKGPVGLLQGPPGTGKTAFISSFIHYVLENGAQNVLLVSQSHEAVNNAAEKVRELFLIQDKKIGIVRLGNEGQVSKGLEDVHELAIQEHYREQFRAEYKGRLQSLASPLGLDQEFVDLCIEFEWSFASKIQKLSALSRMKEVGDSIERTEAAKSRLVQKLQQYAARVGVVMEVRIPVKVISDSGVI